MRGPASARWTWRRGFNLVEMLIALAITAMLLTATMVALDASFMAYQSTTEQVSTIMVARLVESRMTSVTRIAQEYGPYPSHPQTTEIYSDLLELQLPNDDLIGFRLDAQTGILYYQEYTTGNLVEHELLRGIDNPPDVTDLDDDGINNEQRPPFVLEYSLGRQLDRMCCSMVIRPDDVQHLDIEGNYDSTINMEFCVIPRVESYNVGPGSGSS